MLYLVKLKKDAGTNFHAGEAIMAKIEIGLQLGLSVSKQANLGLVTKRCGGGS